MSRIKRHELAHKLAEKIEKYLGDDYGNLIDDLNLNRGTCKWAKEHLRWSIVDEETGEDLLAPQKKRPVKKADIVIFLDGGRVEDVSLPKNLSARIVDFDIVGLSDDEICNDCDGLDQPHYHYIRTFTGRE